MKNSIKKTFAVSLLGLSMFMSIPQLAGMSEATEGIINVLQNGGKIEEAKINIVQDGKSINFSVNDIKTEKTPFITPSSLKWIIPMLIVVAIPFYQLIRKSPKSVIPPEDEYSFQEIRESIAVLWKYYVSNNFKKLIFKNTNETPTDEVKEAAEVLWKNIKNFYNLGIVGQLKRDSLLQLYKGKYIQGCRTTPARGICGHTYDMFGDLEKTVGKVGGLFGAYLFMNMLHSGELPLIFEKSKISMLGK